MYSASAGSLSLETQVSLLGQYMSHKSGAEMAARESSLGLLDSVESAGSPAFSSPVAPPVFDLDPADHLGTVSPHDLVLHDPQVSGPNSTTMTAMTSPSVGDQSPAFSEYLISPDFGTGTMDYETGADSWYTIYPQDGNEASVPRDLNTPALDRSSPAEPTDLNLVDLESASVSGGRRKSQPPSRPMIRHSSVGGVASRRRDRPLPPIVVEDPEDVVAMKRARNTLAARKSRERKAQRLEELEEQIMQLKAERDHWKKLAEERTGV